MKKIFKKCIWIIFAISIIYNIYKFNEISMPIINSSSTSMNKVANWIDSRRVSFLGIPVSLMDKNSNIANGYQAFGGEIKLNYFTSPLTLECKLSNTIVLNNSIIIDGPFESQDRDCKILQFDGENHIARIFAHGIVFDIHETNVVWSDKSGNGSMVTSFDYVLNNSKYH